MKPICRAKDLLEVGSKRTFATSASQGFLFFGTPLALLVGFTKVNTWCKRRTFVLLEQPGWTRRFYFFSFFFCFFVETWLLGLVLLSFVYFPCKLCLSGSQEIATIKLSSSSPMCQGPLASIFNTRLWLRLMKPCPRCPFRHEINPFKSHQRSIAMMAMMVMSPKLSELEIKWRTSTFYCRAHRSPQVAFL